MGEITDISSSISLPSGFVADLARAPSTQDVLAVTASWLPAIIDAERSSVALPSDEGHLQLQAFGGSIDLPYSGRFSIQDSLIGQAFRTYSLINVPDITKIEGVDAEGLAEAGLRSAVIAPMVSSGSALGTINLASSQPDFFGEDEEQALSSIADLIASFIAVNQYAEEHKRQADTDSLTGLMSRSAILAELADAFDDDEHRPSVLYIDVNKFKTINDAHGHAVGDELLVTIGNRMQDLLRDDDSIGRLGGDEFLVVVGQDRSAEVATKLTNRIAESLNQPIRIGSLILETGVSIGVASVESMADSAEDLLSDADQTMYSAKTTGAPSALVSPTIRRLSAMRVAADRDLGDAMRRSEIDFHFQPIRDMRSNEILGAEALVRWDHPEHGQIPATMVIERVEATGRTDVFTRWSLDVAIKRWQRVRTELPWFQNKAIAVNLTPRQLAWTGLHEFLLSSLADADFRTNDVIIEVVESSAIKPGDHAERSLTKLGQSGVPIALDDFGTGHNALGLFTRFPIHGIKLDRTLIGSAVEHDTARRIIRGLSSLAEDLDITAFVEGVESKIEADLCLEAGICFGQGWYFGYPEPLEAFIAAARAEGAKGAEATAAVEEAISLISDPI